MTEENWKRKTVECMEKEIKANEGQLNRWIQKKNKESTKKRMPKKEKEKKK